MTQIASATVKLSEMPREMENFAILSAQEGLTKCYNEQEVAAYLKKEFDTKYGPTWNCFVGRSFGSFVTHEQNHYIYFYIGQTGLLLFKS
ncbi:dynein light chain LC8-type [Angomonas deanei]|uniref:Dynein light chain n=1 Tax=Angomonas deanei TaxID=59799 RepID=S9WUV6_9TRYP|nr:dynein light chain LC8-type [Angomonas deanei]EPY39945.1 dynein light chain LC8-type [Angomonas deanei]CAD2218799.1 Dynein light chain type 1, putative [Angomonas deanei]|eukprot:EPY39750.1 dynein light chain LC8-type [Angomonas deanei]